MSPSLAERLRKAGIRHYDELIHDQLKQNESLRQQVENDLADIKRRPALVRSFFKAPSVSYTKD